MVWVDLVGGHVKPAVIPEAVVESSVEFLIRVFHIGACRRLKLLLN